MKQKEGQFTLIVARGVALLAITVSVMAAALQAQAPTAPGAEAAVPANPVKVPAPAQPVPYSHKVHLALPGMRCQNCHTNPAPGATMELPAAAVCMRCHTSVAKDRPAIQQLARLAKDKNPIPWQRVYVIRPNHVGDVHEKWEKGSGVQWSHKKHTDASVTCTACHGNVAQMDVMAEVTTTTTKGGCMTCHNERSKSQFKAKSTVCATCHQDYQHTMESDWRSLAPRRQR